MIEDTTHPVVYKSWLPLLQSLMLLQSYERTLHCLMTPPILPCMVHERKMLISLPHHMKQPSPRCHLQEVSNASSNNKMSAVVITEKYVYHQVQEGLQVLILSLSFQQSCFYMMAAYQRRIHPSHSIQIHNIPRALSTTIKMCSKCCFNLSAYLSLYLFVYI